MELKKGETIKITLDDQYMEKCDEKTLWLDYKNITKVVQVGSHVYVDDGLITLTVKEVGERLNPGLGLRLAVLSPPPPAPRHVSLCPRLQAATT